jgi:hypothetical protein
MLSETLVHFWMCIQLIMDQHVANTIKSGYFHLRRISRIRCHLDEACMRKSCCGIHLLEP